MQPIVIAACFIVAVMLIAAYYHMTPAAGVPAVTPAGPPATLPAGVTAPRADRRCGAAYGGASCNPGLCCSTNGWCGIGVACNVATNMPLYNGPGVIVAGAPNNTVSTTAPRADLHCGYAWDNARCKPGEFCSTFGWCGTTARHSDLATNQPAFNG